MPLIVLNSSQIIRNGSGMWKDVCAGTYSNGREFRCGDFQQAHQYFEDGRFHYEEKSCWVGAIASAKVVRLLCYRGKQGERYETHCANGWEEPAGVTCRSDRVTTALEAALLAFHDTGFVPVVAGRIILREEFADGRRTIRQAGTETAIPAQTAFRNVGTNGLLLLKDKQLAVYDRDGNLVIRDPEVLGYVESQSYQGLDQTVDAWRRIILSKIPERADALRSDEKRTEEKISNLQSEVDRSRRNREALETLKTTLTAARPRPAGNGGEA
jgi:hypothetical protein